MEGQGTYVEQFNRAKRHYGRLEEINSGQIHIRDSESYRDDFLSFFQNCFHLKDWIKNDDAIILSNKDQLVEDYINGDESLRLCADICNGTKHMKQTRNIRTGKQPQITKADYSLHVGTVPTTLAVKYTIDSASGPIDAFELATRCIDLLSRFIAANL